MGLKIVGSISVKIDDDVVKISGKEFGIEESDNRHLGDGDHQYEALFKYFDPDDRFELMIEAAEHEGLVTQLSRPTIEGNGLIVANELDAEIC